MKRTIQNCPLTGRASEPNKCPCYYEVNCTEIRYYKGMYKIHVLLKAKHTFLCEVLETIPYKMAVGCKFTTVARLCWRKKKQ